MATRHVRTDRIIPTVGPEIGERLTPGARLRARQPRRARFEAGVCVSVAATPEFNRVRDDPIYVYDEILVPTDGSAEAEAAVEHAVGLAEACGARIHALYVIDTSAYASIEGVNETVIEDLRDEGEAAVATVADAAEAAGVPCTTSVVGGGAHETITAYARNHDIDLIVMGTHGRRGVERYLLGSVTERVVRTADVPVMTVRYTE